jgi:hypothetical protein
MRINETRNGRENEDDDPAAHLKRITRRTRAKGEPWSQKAQAATATGSGAGSTRSGRSKSFAWFLRDALGTQQTPEGRSRRRPWTGHWRSVGPLSARTPVNLLLPANDPMDMEIAGLSVRRCIELVLHFHQRLRIICEIRVPYKVAAWSSKFVPPN